MVYLSETPIIFSEQPDPAMSSADDVLRIASGRSPHREYIPSGATEVLGMFIRPDGESPLSQKSRCVVRAQEKLTELGWRPSVVSVTSWLKNHHLNPSDIVPELPASDWSASTPFPPTFSSQTGDTHGISPDLGFAGQGILSREPLPEPESELRRDATSDEVHITVIVGYLRWLLSD
jgi:hypothetical protein